MKAIVFSVEVLWCRILINAVFKEKRLWNNRFFLCFGDITVIQHHALKTSKRSLSTQTNLWFYEDQGKNLLLKLWWFHKTLIPLQWDNSDERTLFCGKTSWQEKVLPIIWYVIFWKHVGEDWDIKFCYFKTWTMYKSLISWVLSHAWSE